MAEKSITVRLNFVVDTSGVKGLSDSFEEASEGAKNVGNESKKAGAHITSSFIKAAAVMQAARAAFRAVVDGLKQSKEGEAALKVLTANFDKVKMAVASGLMPVLNQFIGWMSSNMPAILKYADMMGKAFAIAAQLAANGFMTLKLGFEKAMQNIASTASWIAGKLGFSETAAAFKQMSDDMSAASDQTMQNITDNSEKIFESLKKINEPSKALTPAVKKEKVNKEKKEKDDQKGSYEAMLKQDQEYADAKSKLLDDIEEKKIALMATDEQRNLASLEREYTNRSGALNNLLIQNQISTEEWYKLDAQLYLQYEEEKTNIKNDAIAQRAEADAAYYLGQNESYQIDVEEYTAAQQAKIDYANEVFSAIQNVASQWADVLNQMIQIEVNDIRTAADEKKEEAKRTIKNKKQLEAELAKIDAEAAKKEKEAREQEAAIAIVMAIINTAVGVTKALSSTSPPLSYVLAALTAAAGAAQIAVIASQSFAEGGIVEGTQTTGDNINAKVNAGEMILNRPQQERLLALADGRAMGTRGNISIGGDTIVIQGNATEEAIAGIRQTREDQLRELRQMLVELEYTGQSI